MRAAVRGWLRLVARWLHIPENQLLPDADAAPAPPQQAPVMVLQQPVPAAGAPAPEDGAQLVAAEVAPPAAAVAPLAAAADLAGVEPPRAPDAGAGPAGIAAEEGAAVAGPDLQPGAHLQS